MSILSRYLLRQHVAPFVFALAALTSLMLLNQIAKRFGDLVGKGLPWGVIIEVFALSIPFIVAMTLPMAVLVAVLYATSRLAADSEVTAMRAGGISLWRLLRPLLAAAALVTVVSFAFSDHILPRTNHRLRTLYSDISRKKPTFSLKEQVINEVQRSRLFLRAASIDPAANYALRDVAIYDLADQDRKRVIYADSGFLAITADQEDAYLTLYTGTMHEFDRTDPGMFQIVGFERDVVRIEGVGNELRRTLTDSFKGDREMGVCEMEENVANARRDEVLARRRAIAARSNALFGLVGLPTVEPDTVVGEFGPGPYCTILKSWVPWLLPPELEAQDISRTKAQAEARNAARQPPRLLRGTPPGLRASELRAHEDRARISETRAAQFMVEIHKKYAIACACFVFVLLGVPLAIRFPRGGLGFVIGVSLGTFAIYYIGLIGGESLADRMQAPPWILWVPNILFTLAGAILLRRSRTAATAPAATGIRARFTGQWRRPPQ
jgi:lipopolysaccharide export system permease protein